MQGIELVLIFSLLSSFLSLFSALSSLLCPVLDSRNRILAFSQGIMRPRGRPPRRNAAIRHDPGANTPCSELSWGSLSVPFCDLFSLLSSRFSCSRYTRECANPDAVQAVAFVSDPSSRLSLRSVHEAIGFAPNCFVLWRHPDPDCKGVFHRVVYTSISAQYPNQYANLVFPFSRITCCSTVAPSMARSANPAAARLHHRWRATLLRPKATLRSSSRRGFLIEIIPHLIVLNIPMSIQTWLCLRLR